MRLSNQNGSAILLLAFGAALIIGLGVITIRQIGLSRYKQAMSRINWLEGFYGADIALQYTHAGERLGAFPSPSPTPPP